MVDRSHQPNSADRGVCLCLERRHDHERLVDRLCTAPGFAGVHSYCGGSAHSRGSIHLRGHAAGPTPSPRQLSPDDRLLLSVAARRSISVALSLPISASQTPANGFCHNFFRGNVSI